MLLRFFTFKRFIFYVFPVYLMVSEYAIRYLLSYVPGRPEDIAIVGTTSTVTSAGLSLIAPVLIPKPVVLRPSVARIVEAAKVRAIRPGDLRLIAAAYVALLALPLTWGWALWMVHTGETRYDVSLFGLRAPGPIWVAFLIYVTGMAFSEFKEVV